MLVSLEYIQHVPLNSTFLQISRHLLPKFCSYQSPVLCLYNCILYKYIFKNEGKISMYKIKNIKNDQNGIKWN